MGAAKKSVGVRKVGFFGGSFDPIHIGHINLALCLLEAHSLDEILFCPTSQSPHKSEKPPVAMREHRKAMCAAAISPIPQFTLLDLEIQRSSYSYTIETIRTMMKMDAENKAKPKQYYLILGQDSLEGLETWKEVDELLVLAPPLIGSRGGYEFPKSMPKNLITIVKKGQTEIPELEISSTMIRDRLHKGLYAGHLLPIKVWDYIQQNKIYIPEK
ncbi:MAG: nicotinate (nicotinamide) nucleotide adenylyltransferase [Verrucomicrobia bacterium]|nr:nicotinate (nicotinamide) nucleotide adenylyltransferase [Verrucomicrobiota bacterium]